MIWVNYNMVISNCSLITCEMGLDFFEHSYELWKSKKRKTVIVPLGQNPQSLKAM